VAKFNSVRLIFSGPERVRENRAALCCVSLIWSFSILCNRHLGVYCGVEKRYSVFSKARSMSIDAL
jgi:hypothetical protein